MGWSCAVCGERIPDSDKLLTSPRYLGERWEWPCVCSLCGAPMHTECFTKNPLDPRVAKEVGKARAVRVSHINGFGFEYYLCSRCDEYVDRQFLKERSEHLEKEGRYEDLAELYEAYGDRELASEARAKGTKAHRVRRKQQELDAQLAQMHERGLKAVLYCSSCGAPLIIGQDDDTEGLKFCGRCGKKLDEDVIEDAIRDALGS